MSSEKQGVQQLAQIFIFFFASESDFTTSVCGRSSSTIFKPCLFGCPLNKKVNEICVWQITFLIIHFLNTNKHLMLHGSLYKKIWAVLKLSVNVGKKIERQHYDISR